MPKKTKADQKTDYTLTLQFPNKIKASKVTQIDFQVTSVPPPAKPLPQNKMPDSIAVGDTITFTYQTANPDVKIKSSLLTRYNVETSQKETDKDFIDQFDKPMEVKPDFVGSWVFHLLGLYKFKGKRAAYYLDPEVTFHQ